MTNEVRAKQARDALLGTGTVVDLLKQVETTDLEGERLNIVGRTGAN